ncbi:hypothetical protein MHC_04815 [Mycoplasma haemocanis str. Illinois]|uniref:Uncharacterized protein n=1 Tax=Mycoplasma haemocanis (strain Illinois) TaxID=1111676 RepID=H6N847_MYCHN|nr:hypothetical protein [Mycoplasma haemocanis]AEW45819.1 hypothetical protein MHC_04815 [Mycoplasma haemocanis str. Illinois]
MDVLIKSLVGLGVAGTVAGGGVLLSRSNLFGQSKTRITIKDEIEKRKWTLLTSSNLSEISEIQTAYKKSNPLVTLKFDGLTGNESDFATRLLNECRALYEKEFDSSYKEDLFEQLEKWCVVPKTVGQRLKDFNIIPISTDDPTSPNKETDSWKQKGKAHHGAQDGKFSDLTTKGGDGEEDAKALRGKCKVNLAVKSFEEGFKDTLGKVKSWCAN